MREDDILQVLNRPAVDQSRPVLHSERKLALERRIELRQNRWGYSKDVKVHASTYDWFSVFAEFADDLILHSLTKSRGRLSISLLRATLPERNAL